MIKPNMPNIPGMGAMTDTLDFVKNMWGSMGLPGVSMPGLGMPGMVMPTLSVEDINKKITDLKAVESWLALNMNMLRGTIQALEVQVATISALQSMGQTFSATMQPGAQQKPSEQTAPKVSPLFSAFGLDGSHGAAAPSTAEDAHGPEKLHGAPEPTSKDETDAANLTAPLVNAAAWWNMLQDQFKQAVNTAMTEVPTPATAAKPKPKAKPKAESAASSAAATRKRKTPVK